MSEVTSPNSVGMGPVRTLRKRSLLKKLDQSTSKERGQKGTGKQVSERGEQSEFRWDGATDLVLAKVT